MITSYDCLPCAPAIINRSPFELTNAATEFRKTWFPSTVGIGTRSEAGIHIDHDRSLGHPAILQGVNILRGALAQVKVSLVRETRTASGKKRIEEVNDHPGAQVARNRTRIRESQNGTVMTICQYRGSTMNHAILAGDGWGAIQRNGRGEPVSKTLLPPYPDTAVKVRDSGQVFVETRVRTPAGIRTFELDPINVFQIQNLSYDGLSGYPLFEHAANTIGIGLAGYKYVGRSWANDATPRGVLQNTGIVGDPEKEAHLAQWYAMHRGLDNSGEIAYLDGGTTYNPLGGMSHADAMIVEYLQEDVKTQARLLNIPPFLLGVTESSGLKMAEAIAWFVQFTLGDWLCNWAEQMRIKLLTESEWLRGDLRFVFDVSSFLMTNWPEYVKTIVEAVGGPVLQRSEGRTFLQVNPDVDDGEFLERSTGSKPPQEDAPEPQEATNTLEDVQNRLDRIDIGEAKRMAEAESRCILAAAKEHGADGIESTMDDWKHRYGERFSKQAAEEYTQSRKAEVLQLLEHGLGAIERDMVNASARAMRLVELDLRKTNGVP